MKITRKDTVVRIDLDSGGFLKSASVTDILLFEILRLLSEDRSGVSPTSYRDSRGVLHIDNLDAVEEIRKLRD